VEGRAGKLLDKIFGREKDYQVSNPELVKYATGIAGQNISFSFISGWFQHFCIAVMGYPKMIISSILAISRVWDAFNDPLVGGIIDKHVFKNGEKLRPFLKITPIPIGILIALLFMDFGLAWTQTVVFIIVVYFLFDFLYSFQDIAQWGMTALISTNSKERAKISQVARIGAMIGALPSGLIILIIGNRHALGGISEKDIFFILGIVFGFGGMVLSLFNYAAKERAPVIKMEEGLIKSFRLLFSNKMVMLVVLGNILSVCTLTVNQIYFFKYMVSANVFGREINGLNISFIFGLVVGLPGAIGMFLSQKLMKRVGGPKNLLILGVAANIIFRLIAFFVGYEGIRIMIMGVLMALAGIPTAMAGIATTTLLGDSLDYMEWKTGKRNEGAVYSTQNFTAKIGGAIQTFFTGVTLVILQFDSDAYNNDTPQPDAFYRWVWPIFMLAPVIGSLLHIIPMLFIRYDNAQKERLEKQLAIARAIRAGDYITVQEKYGITNCFAGKDIPESAKRLYQRASFLHKKEEEEEILC